MFENYTDKTTAYSAERHLQERFEDLFDDGADEVEATEAEQVEAALRDPEQTEIFTVLRAQGEAHRQSQFNATLNATLAGAGPAN